MKHSIFLFMWGYQSHYRILLETRVKEIFSLLGIEDVPKVFLVGARSPQNNNPNPVCIEPEEGEWPLTLFPNLLDAIEENVKCHRLNNMFYSDERSMTEKPEVIRRSSVTQAVHSALQSYDLNNNVNSFCGSAYPIGDYYVVPVIQVPGSVFEKFPPLKKVDSDDTWFNQGYRSLIHAGISSLLEEATEELKRKDPGHSTSLKGTIRQADEILRIAADRFMYTPSSAIKRQYAFSNLFERFNLISSLMYEGTKGIGRLLLINPENIAIDYLMRFKTPVPFHEPRWARKVLQMAAQDIALIADSEKIYGLGKLYPNFDPSIDQNVFIIEFLDHYHWELRCGNLVLMQSNYGTPQLPKEPINQILFFENYTRLFPKSTAEDRNLIWKIIDAATHQSHGSMIVVANDAKEEANRLSQQGTSVEPKLITEELLQRVSGIDGTIILDPHGICHAIGVILDGMSAPDCTPSRGSRFNSGVRYVNAGNLNRMAIVISDDHTIDIIPELRLNVRSADVEFYISALEQANLDNYHKPRNWLDEHRFYLQSDQCQRVNVALDRIESLPKEVGQFVILTSRFKIDPDMNDSYLAA